MKKIFFAALALFALALILTPAAGWSPYAADGQKVFMAEGCNVCHSVSSAGIEAKMKSAKMKGPDLTDLYKSRDAAWIGKYLHREEKIDGKAHMKPFKGSDEELQALVDWLLEQKSM